MKFPKKSDPLEITDSDGATLSVFSYAKEKDALFALHISTEGLVGLKRKQARKLALAILTELA